MAVLIVKESTASYTRHIMYELRESAFQCPLTHAHARTRTSRAALAHSTNLDPNNLTDCVCEADLCPIFTPISSNSPLFSVTFVDTVWYAALSVQQWILYGQPMLACFMLSPSIGCGRRDKGWVAPTVIWVNFYINKLINSKTRGKKPLHYTAQETSKSRAVA